MFRSTGTIVILCLALVLSAQTQWINQKSDGIPRTRDGKPALSARPPIAANRKPDLSGIWTTDATPLDELNRLFPDIGALAVPGDENLQPVLPQHPRRLQG
jgi:hypothetical protein